jgi:TraL protein
MLCAAALLCSAAASAAPCRSQTAATAGANAGYQRDKAAAEELETKSSASSDVLSKCLNSISTVKVAPAFPSLDSIFSGMLERACKVTLDKVREGLPPVPPSWPALPNPPSAAAAGAQPPATAAIPAPRPQILPATAEARPAPVDSSDFWKRIWR